MCDEKVCRDMFVKTLCISTKRVNTALKKKTSGSIDDKRGKKMPPNKLSSQKEEKVVQHIKRFPRYKSHYTRAESQRKFLSPELTLAKMYELYKSETLNPVSLSKYKQIFYTRFNLRFKPVKKDTCKTCPS